MTTTRTDTEVYRDHAVELTRYATVLVGPDDAPDVVADAVLDAFASPKWHDIEHQRAYLFRSVLHHANSFHRSTSRRRRRDHLAVVRARSNAFDPEPSVDAQHALRTLSPQQRAVIYFSYWEDQPVSDIAALLDISEGSVRKQLARARVQLRKVMAS